MLRILLVGLLVLMCIIETQDALFMGGKTMQDFVDDTIDRAMTKVSKKLQHKLEVLKDNKVVLKLWNYYKSFYRKEYQTIDEEKERLGKFTNNLKIIIKGNVRFDQGGRSFKLHLNQFGDMDFPEFRQKMTGLRSDETVYIKSSSMQQRQKRFLFDSVKKKIKKVKDKFNKKVHPENYRTTNPDTFDVPSQPVTRTNQITRRPTTTATSASMVDYRPYMGPIENQGQCGSCYAFAVTAAVEGTFALKTGVRMELSQQQLIDCSPNMGCSGGYLGTTLEYIKKSGGLEPDTSYPYVGSQQSCSMKSANVGAIKGYGNTPPNDEEEMKRALITYGPLAAAICATSDLQFYGPSQRSGASDIIDLPSCPKEVNHAIAIVGYGTENGQDYWLVRNSWGENWGLDGYFKLARNKGNMCGIATYGGYYTEV